MIQCGKIHASVIKNLISLFKDQIDEGSDYVIESFMVGSNDHAYKTTNHKYKLNFMGGTKVLRVSFVNIPSHHFNFVPFLQIVSAPREDRLLGKKFISIQFNQTWYIPICFLHITIVYLDVIGHVVEKDVIKETEKNEKRSKVLDIMLEDLE